MLFKVLTDRQTLKLLHDLKNTISRLASRAIYLCQHKITVEHRRGIINEAPDALSHMFNVNIDPNDWKKVIEETIQE